MKFPPKFGLALLPVTLAHLLAITIFGIVMREDEGYLMEDRADSFANSAVEIPGYHQLEAGTELMDGLSSALFPESGLSREVELPVHGSVSNTAPVASEVEKSESATIFPFEESAVKRGGTGITPKQRGLQPATDEKARRRHSSEPAPGIRGFRPVTAKKTS